MLKPVFTLPARHFANGNHLANWAIKISSDEIFDYKLQPKINVTDALFPRINS